MAVKVQYAGLQTAVTADITTLSVLAAAATRWFPDAFDFGCHPLCCFPLWKWRMLPLNVLIGYQDALLGVVHGIFQVVPIGLYSCAP